MQCRPTPRPPEMHCLKMFLEYKEEVKRAVMQAQGFWVSFIFHALSTPCYAESYKGNWFNKMRHRNQLLHDSVDTIWI